MLEALAYAFEFCNRLSANNSEEAVTESWLPEQGGCSTLEALPYDSGFCDRRSVIDSAECLWQRVGHLGVGVAAC